MSSESFSNLSRQGANRRADWHAFRERKLPFGFLLTAFAMIAIGLFTYRIPDQQKQQGDWVAHTQEVLAQLATLSLHLTNAETGQRGYLLTGQTIYLQSYSLAVQQINGDVARYQQLTRDNPRQQSRMPLLRSQIAAKLAELKQTIKLRDSLRLPSALDVVYSVRGKRLMMVIQQQIGQMRVEQQSLLQQRVLQWNAASEKMRRTFQCGGILLYILIGVAYLFAQKEVRYRTRLMELEQQATHIQRAEAERLEKIVAIQRDVAYAGQDLQTTMQTIVERTQEITYAEGCVVSMVEDDHLVCRFVSGIATPHLGLHLKASGSLEGLCMRENRVIKCDDTETDDRVNRGVCRRFGARSMIVVPLRTSGRTVGVLRAISSRAAAFTESDVANMQLLGGVLSAALNGAFTMDALRASEMRLEEAQQVAHVGSWELDLATKRITWSKEVFALFGLIPEWGEPDYAAALALYTPEDAARLDACLQSAVRERGGFALDLQQAVAEGETPRWYHLVGKPVLNAQEKVVRLIGTLLDITQSKRHATEMEATNVILTDTNAALERANIELQIRATTDSLTGLQNHRAFQERLKEEYQRAKRYNSPLSVVLLDVDHFKQFNDTFGHPAGDKVLKIVASLLERTARMTDLIARYGGEEFVLLLPETDAEGALKIAERVRQSIADATWEERAVTVSVGSATLDTTIESAAHLVDTADKAMYRSKAMGRNCVSHTGGGLSLVEDGVEDGTAICRGA